MWQLDHKEGWAQNWYLWILVLDFSPPLTARKLSQSILKEINPEYSLEGLMLKLKLQYFSHLMWSADSLEKTLMMEKIKGRRRGGRQRMRWLDGITKSTDLSLSKLWKTMKDRGVYCSPWGCKESDTTEQLNDNVTCSKDSLFPWRSFAYNPFFGTNMDIS